MKKIVFAVVCCCFLVLLSSCQSQDLELEPVTLRLKWLHQSQFAGHYVAVEEGYYAEEGLDVSILPYDFVHNPIAEVVNGDAHFGIMGADDVLVAQARGDPIKVVAVIYRINPNCLFSLKELGVTKPQDMVGKKVGLEATADGAGVVPGPLYKAMLNKLEISRDSFTEVPISYDYSELRAGEVDISIGYVTNSPFEDPTVNDEKLNTILMADYGVNMYADVLFVHNDIIESNPELVQDFVTATLVGWEKAISNQDVAVEYVMRYASNTTPSAEKYMLEQSVPLIKKGFAFIGVMSDREWDQAQDILVAEGVLEEKLLLSKVYTNHFAELAHS